MGRLIDADLLREEVNSWGTNDYEPSDFTDAIDDAPTVEAIPKAEVKKFLEEGTKDVGNNVLAIVREDYIHKADYENRLRADMVAMLIELKNKLIDKSWNIDMYDDDLDFECCYLNDIDGIIQQKIDKLKENTNGANID